MKAPYAVSEGGRELHKTYLDTLGRNVVVLLKDGVVENHIQDFQVPIEFVHGLMGWPISYVHLFCWVDMSG